MKTTISIPRAGGTALTPGAGEVAWSTECEITGGAQPRSRAWEESDGSITLELLSVEGLSLSMTVRPGESAQTLRTQCTLAGIEVEQREARQDAQGSMP